MTNRVIYLTEFLAPLKFVIAGGCIATFLFLALCHFWVAILIQADQGGTEELYRSLSWALGDPKKSKKARIYVFSRPENYAVVVKSLANRKAFLVSQGLLSEVRESDLRQLFRLGDAELRRP